MVIKKRARKAQVTLFVILAIAIVGIILVLFIPNVRKVFISQAVDIEIKDCLKENIEEVLPEVLAKGGNLEPSLYYTYDGEDLDYLCYTNEFYETCVMQKPLLKQNVEAELEQLTKQNVDVCINKMKDSLRAKGYSIETTGEETLDIRFIPDNALLELNLEIIAKKEDEVRTFDNLNTKIKTNAYKMMMIASSIANFEARYGDADPQTYMTFYEDIKVEKKKQMDGTTIYLITDRDSELELNFASRSLAWPPGYGY